MQVAEFAPSQIAGVVAQDSLRRVEALALLIATASRLTTRRRQEIEAVIEQVRIALLRGDAAKLESTFAALDLLSLELCDD